MRRATLTAAVCGLVLFWLGVATCVARAATISVPAAGLAKAAVGARPGDTIVATGAGGFVTLTGRKDLTLDLTAARLPGIMLKDSDRIRITGGAFAPTGWQGGVYVLGSRTVRISGIAVDAQPAWPGVSIRDSDDVILEGARIDRPNVGVTVLASTRVRVAGAAVTGAGKDGYDIGGSQDVTVENSVCAGFRPSKGAHNDCVQLWNIDGAPTLARITVWGLQAHGQMQGIGFYDKAGGRGVDGLTVSFNDIASAFANGITAYNVRGGIFRDNRVRTLPGLGYWSRLTLEGDVVRCGNSVGPGAGKAGVVDAPCTPP